MSDEKSWDAESLVQHICETLTSVVVLEAQGDSYFYYDPNPSPQSDRRFPFITLVTGDRHDQFSQLDRDGVYRLNIGVRKATFRSLFGESAADEPRDYAAFDTLLPHPVYGTMYWLCVVNPGPKTFPTIEKLLAEAHQMATERYEKGIEAHGDE